MFRNVLCFLLICSGLVFSACKQNDAPAEKREREKPRLVVLLSFDQMRGDYLERWRHLWSAKGFGRVLAEGRRYENCYFGHAFTATGPGHAILATGTYPHRHSISGNSFYDTDARARMYCVEDTAAPVTGFPRPTDGRSPRNLKVKTLGDYVKQADARSKVISLSLKDRAAVIMGGHRPDAAVWLDKNTFKFTTSAYYEAGLPAWVEPNLPAREALDLMLTSWTPFLADSAYDVPDSAAGEGLFPMGGASFPHVFPEKTINGFKQLYSAYAVSPYSARPVFSLAHEAVSAERLGADSATDVLCISISNTDYVGHQFGPDSRELVDTYLLCDTLLGRLIDHLDTAVGRAHYVLALSSDHGVAPIPEQAKAQGLAAGRLAPIILHEAISAFLEERFPLPDSVSAVEAAPLPHIFLNKEALLRHGLSADSVIVALQTFLSGHEAIHIVVDGRNLFADAPPAGMAPELQRHYRKAAWRSRTGDVILVPEKYWLLSETPATHGSPWDYDRHVPLVFMGAGIEPGLDTSAVSPADVTPTIARFLGLSLDPVDGRALDIR